MCMWGAEACVSARREHGLQLEENFPPQSVCPPPSSKKKRL